MCNRTTLISACLSMQVPSACFVQPPLAYVGYTEEEAIKKFSGNIDVYVSKFKPMKNTISGRDERTFMKLLVHADTDQVDIQTIYLREACADSLWAAEWLKSCVVSGLHCLVNC